MSDQKEVRFRFNRKTFFELKTPTNTLFIDPVYPESKRGKRKAIENASSCNYVLTTSMTPWFDDTLDILEENLAVFIGSPRVVHCVEQELDIGRDRLLDLKPWERASEEGFRVTAIPISASIGMEHTVLEGASLLQDMTGVVPKAASQLPLLGFTAPIFNAGVRSARQVFGEVTRNIPGAQQISHTLGLGGYSNGKSFGGGRPGIGFCFEIEGHYSLLHLADGIHQGVYDEDLEDIADVCKPDILSLHVDGNDVTPYVRAARILKPKTMLLYRSIDPYASGARTMQTRTVPMNSFIDAILEGTENCDIQHLKAGHEWVIEKSSSNPIPKETRKPLSGML